MTATPAQIAANRINSTASTGPRTPEGKQAAKYNRLCHGLCSPLAVLPFENQDEYNNLYAAFCEEYSPLGPSEQALVKQIADAQWKMRRLETLEQNVFIAMQQNSQNEPDQDPFAAMAATLLGTGKHQQALNSLARYQSTLNRQFMQAVKELRKLQAARKLSDEEAEKRNVIRQIIGITERSQSDISAIDILANDPAAIKRYIDAEAAILGAQNVREIRAPRATIQTDLEC
jgi:hypothetical protein